MKVGDCGASAGVARRSPYPRKVERMFLGRFEHTLDEKGRLTVPSRYREFLREGFYLTQGFDRNLMVLTPALFEHVYSYINKMSLTDPDARSLKRLILSSAERFELDKQGRILIPQYQREYAQLTVQIVVVGNGDYFEIWSRDEWQKQKEVLQNPEINEHRFAAFSLPIG